MSEQHLLEVRNLRTCFRTESGLITAVDGVSLHLDRGETLGVVGESGCGKSVTALSILRLIQPPGQIADGEVLLAGTDLRTLPTEGIERIRGDRIAMIFQEPMTALNPVYTIGDQIAEPMLLHQHKSSAEAWVGATDLLRLVGIPLPERRIHDYPHQLSGGMRQRAMIAMALACRPELLIADEPTTALDVTIQAQILELMKRLRAEIGMAMMLITHDLGVVAEMCDRVIVMYAGKVIEAADVFALFDRPLHPYTRGLLASIPHLDGDSAQNLNVIDGVVPDPLHFPAGCRFHPRCPEAAGRCLTEAPPLVDVGGRSIACWHEGGESR